MTTPRWTRRLCTLATLLITGCAPEAGEWWVGEDLRELRFEPWTEDVGVYPDVSILEDPNNPFAGNLDPNGDLKWDVLASGCDLGVYAFATALALQPTGEHQVYTAQCMQSLYEGGRVADEDLYLVWTLAARGYESVLENFPDDVTYDTTGEIAFPVAPIAEAGLEALGAVPAEVENPNAGATQ